MLLPLALTFALATGTSDGGAEPGWVRLADGVELRSFVLDPAPAFADGLLQVVRIDPAQAQLAFALASEEGGGKRTAGEWADRRGFVAAINAGMFATDHRGNVGRLVNGPHANNPGWHPSYQSVLAFGPTSDAVPAATLVDLDTPGAREALTGYRSAVQNLRLLKGGGENVWKPGPKKWSEAAVALDAQGRVLFLFARSPMPMHAFNQRLRDLPLGITRAMHVEGGPEASLSVRAPGVRLDLCGSYESFFRDDDGNTEQWPIPNVLGVLAPPAVRPTRTPEKLRSTKK